MKFLTTPTPDTSSEVLETSRHFRRVRTSCILHVREWRSRTLSVPVGARRMPAEKGRDWLCRTIFYANLSKKFLGQDPGTCLLFHIEVEAPLPQQHKSPPLSEEVGGRTCGETEQSGAQYPRRP